MANTPSNAKRSTKRAPFHHFDDTAKLLGLTHVALANLLGYADSSFHDWLAKRDMPYVAKLACDALLMAENKPLAAPPPILIICPPADKLAAVDTMLTALGVPSIRVNYDSLKE